MTERSQQFGKYLIVDILGKGGFATVCRARDITLDRDVALKILHPQLLMDTAFVQRFRQEARTLAALRHPSIVTIYEVSEAAKRQFIAMELAYGPSLAQEMVARGRIPWAEMLALLKPICDALDYAHGQGVVHRDLKPANILLDKDRGPLLTDFGFARLLGESSVSLSLSGGIAGTPGYIAPEVWEKNTVATPGDIYALGCIVYELLTGTVLFAGETPLQALHAHDRGPQFPVTWPDDVPAGIEVVLRKALAREPGNRYSSAGALWHALENSEAQAQTVRIDDERAALIAQWRTETERAIAAGNVSAARMALGRWLALAPDDGALHAAQAELERLASISSRKSEDTSTSHDPLLQELLTKDTRQEGAQPLPIEPKALAQPRRMLWWVWVLGGLAAVVLVVAVVLSLVIGGNRGGLPAPTSLAVFSSPTIPSSTEAAPSATVGALLPTPGLTATPVATQHAQTTTIPTQISTLTPRIIATAKPTQPAPPTARPTQLVPPTDKPIPTDTPVPPPTPTTGPTSLEQAVMLIDSNIQTIQGDPSRWKAALQQVADRLPADIDNTVQVDARNLVNRSNATTDFHCASGALGTHTIEALQGLKAQLRHENSNPVRPLFCPVSSASTIDLNSASGKWADIILYGYDLDYARDLNIIRVNAQGAQSEYPANLVDKSLPYQFKINVTNAAAQLYRDQIRKLALSWGGAAAYPEITVVPWRAETATKTVSIPDTQYVPPHPPNKGDSDFDVHGDQPTTLTVSAGILKSDDSSTLSSIVYMYAREDQPDNTEVEGYSDWKVCYIVESGWTIIGFTPQSKSLVANKKITKSQSDGDPLLYQRPVTEIVDTFKVWVDKNGDEAGTWSRMVVHWRALTVTIQQTQPTWLR